MVKNKDRKYVILKGAFDVFATEGYHGLSMRQLANALGVTTGTLYHHYRSKDELFLDLIRHQAQADIAAAAEFVRTLDTTKERLTALISFVTEQAEYFTKLILIIIDLMRGTDRSSFTKMHKAIIAAASEYRAAIAVVLDIQDTKAARAVFSFIVGSLLSQLVGAPPSAVSDLPVLLSTFKREDTNSDA